MSRHARAILAVAATCVLATGCGLIPGTGDEASSSPTPSRSTPAPTRPADNPDAVEATPEGQDTLTATVESFEADGQGFAKLTYTLKNVGSEDYLVTSEFKDPDSSWSFSVQVANVQVLDEKAQLVQYTLTDTGRNCLCFWEPPGAAYFNLYPDDEAVFANIYQISDEAQTVTVMLPGFQPVKGVQVKRP